MSSPGTPVASLLAAYQPHGETETADLERVRALTKTASDPWLRTLPLHVTGSALIVHPASGRVLLRWHQRQQAWLQVGGHGDPGESEPLEIALREAAEETGLTDLVPWPDAAREENQHAPLRWLSLPEAYQTTSEANLRETLSRAERLLAG